MIGPVVLSVGGVEIDLYHVPAGYVAGVGDGDLNLDITVGVHVAHGEVGPLEGSVGQAVAEGILHHLAIVVVSGVALVQHLVKIAGLVVLVAHVDALVIEHAGLHVLAVVHQHHVAHVLHGGRGEGVVGEGVHQVAGGIHIAAEHIGDGAAGVAAGAGSPQDGGDVLVVLDPAQLKGVVGVDHDDDVVEVIVQVLDNTQLHGVWLQVVLVLVLLDVGPVAHVAAQVTALAAGAGDEEHGSGAHCLILGLLGNGGDGGLVDGPVLGAAVHNGAAAAGVGAGVVAVELPQGLVDREALLGEGGAHVAGDGAHARAGAAGQQVHGRGGKQAQLGSRRHGQALAVFRVVVEEHEALGAGLAGIGLLGGLELVGVGDVPGIVLRIHPLRGSAGLNLGLTEDVPKHQIKRGCGHHSEHHREYQQHGQ